MSHEGMEIQITVKIGEKTFDCGLKDDIDGQFYHTITEELLKEYLARTTEHEEIIRVLLEDEYYRKVLAYNPNIGSEIADLLVDKLEYETADRCRYIEAYLALLSNPSLSSKKLKELMFKHLLRYKSGEPFKHWYRDYDMLMAIANNPSTDSITLYYLNRCGIPEVENAVKQ